MSTRDLLPILVFSLLISCKKHENSTPVKSIPSENRELIPEHNKNPVLSHAEVDAALIAKANGYALWKNVKSIDFTLNVDRGDQHFERSWTWKIKEGKVTLTTHKDTITYNRSAIDSTSLPVDQGFINDKFWLLAPFNLVWDEGIALSKEKNVEAPISKEKLDKLTVVYGEEGGYTPGDAYDFFYDKYFMVREWIFRKANSLEPSLINTWEDREDFGGIKISKMRKNEDGSFKLYFTNISIEKY